jgi:hypothetical protein
MVVGRAVGGGGIAGAGIGVAEVQDIESQIARLRKVNRLLILVIMKSSPVEDNLSNNEQS